MVTWSTQDIWAGQELQGGFLKPQSVVQPEGHAGLFWTMVQPVVLHSAYLVSLVLEELSCVFFIPHLTTDKTIFCCPPVHWGWASSQDSLVFLARTQHCYEVIHQYTEDRLFEHLLQGLCRDTSATSKHSSISAGSPAPLPCSHMLIVAVLVQSSEGLSQMAKYNWVYNNPLNVFIGSVNKRNACETTASAWQFFICI